MASNNREPLSLGWHPAQLGIGLDEDGGTKVQQRDARGSALLQAAKAMERPKGWAK